jgi:hypothetical protein
MSNGPRLLLSGVDCSGEREFIGLGFVTSFKAKGYKPEFDDEGKSMSPLMRGGKISPLLRRSKCTVLGMVVVRMTVGVEICTHAS